MFTKIVSQLSLSPATVERLAQYARVIQRRQRLYGWSAIVFAILSILYSVTLLFPPVYTSSSTANDLVPGGFSSYESVVSAYDNNIDGFRDTAQLLSIDRGDLTRLTPERCYADDMSYVTGRTIYDTASQGRAYHLPDATHLYLHDADSEAVYAGWCGATASGQRFAVIAADGNITTNDLPPFDAATVDRLTKSLTVDTAHAAAGDTITWRLVVANTTSKTIVEDIWFDTGDMTEYTHSTTASDNGIVSRSHHGVLWPALSLSPEEKRTLTLTAPVKNPIDETAQQRHNLHAYDCQITSSFGTTTSVHIACPFIKHVERALYSLPPVHGLLGLVAFVGLTVVCLVAYAVSRFHAREIRIIRTQINTGGVL